MITELEKFETIRYPDELINRGAAISFGFGRGAPARHLAIGRTEPGYQIGFGDVDAFFARCFSLFSLNPKFFFSFLSSKGRAVLVEGNEESGDWLG